MAARRHEPGPLPILNAMARPTRRFHPWSALRPSSLRVEPTLAHDLLAGGALLIDVRRHDDDSEPLPGAVRIMPDAIPEAMTGFRREVPIVLACT
jgi:hypothetical protein